MIVRALAKLRGDVWWWYFAEVGAGSDCLRCMRGKLVVGESCLTGVEASVKWRVVLPDRQPFWATAHCSPLAEVAELADAHGSGPCTRKGVGVRVPSSAPEFSGICYNPRIIGSDSAWCRGTPKPARGHTATHRSGCRRSHLHRVGAKIL